MHIYLFTYFRYNSIDPPNAIDKPSFWKFQKNFEGKSDVIAQSSQISSSLIDQKPTILEPKQAKVKKFLLIMKE